MITKEPAAQVYARGATPSRGHVLVVDDEEPNRTLLRDPLEALGFEVAEAAGAFQALECVAQRVPDSILLDVRCRVWMDSNSAAD